MSQTAEASATPPAAAGRQIAAVRQPDRLLQWPMRTYLCMVAIDVPSRGSHVDFVGRRDA